MGRFVVLEGMDGSGKSTQVRGLTEYFQRQGLRVKSFHFPSEKGFYGEMISAFLRGDFGEADMVDPYFASFIFAGDRRDMADSLRAWIEEYDVVLLDRYSFSNNAYQCAKIADPEEREKLSKWIMDLEFNVFGIPRPDISIFLSVPQSFVNVQLNKNRKGAAREYLKGKSDIHEKDYELQVRVGEMYRMMCQKYPELVLVDCADEKGNMLRSGSIQKKIISIIEAAE